MELLETHVYIHAPVSALLDGRDFRPLRKTDEEAIYVIEADGSHPSHIGLLQDLLTDGSWTQLLVDCEVDAKSIANALLELNVETDKIAPTTTWDGKPYVDVPAIGAEMDRQRPRRPRMRI